MHVRRRRPRRERHPKVLPISNGRGRVVDNCGLYVHAAMMEPEASPDRLTLSAAVEREAMLHTLRLPVAEKLTLSPDFAVALAEMPRLEEVMRPEFQQRWTRGCIAGELLLLLLSLAAYCREHSSLRKALEIKHRDLVENDGNRTIGGTRFAYGKSFVEECWKQFRGVAHLFAAFCIERDGGFEHCKGRRAVALFGKGDQATLGFLACAEGLRWAGERHRPPAAERFSKGALVTLLRPSETWRPPRDLLLPRMALEVPRPTEWTLEVLGKYRARAGAIDLNSGKSIA